LARSVAREIRGRKDLTKGRAAQLGIQGPEHIVDFSTAKPVLTGSDLTGGAVQIAFPKSGSDGINIYCQREGDKTWVLLGRATVSPFVDNRPLLDPGKPELRRYSAVYVVKDKEVGNWSDEVVVNCAP
jgi:hypothetical protein